MVPKPNGSPPIAGWIPRLQSGKPQLEQPKRAYNRTSARTQGMTGLLEELDLRVATELYHWSPKANMYYNQEVLLREQVQAKEHCISKQIPRHRHLQVFFYVQDLLANTPLGKIDPNWKPP